MLRLQRQLQLRNGRRSYRAVLVPAAHQRQCLQAILAALCPERTKFCRHLDAAPERQCYQLGRNAHSFHASNLLQCSTERSTACYQQPADTALWVECCHHGRTAQGGRPQQYTPATYLYRHDAARQRRTEHQRTHRTGGRPVHTG